MCKWHTHFQTINEVCTLTIERSLFSVMAALIVEILLMLYSVYNTVLWAENEWSWKHILGKILELLDVWRIIVEIKECGTLCMYFKRLFKWLRLK